MVAVISKIKADNIKKGSTASTIKILSFSKIKRLITADIDGIKIINVYVPNDLQ